MSEHELRRIALVGFGEAGSILGADWAAEMRGLRLHRHPKTPAEK